MTITRRDSLALGAAALGATSIPLHRRASGGRRRADGEREAAGLQDREGRLAARAAAGQVRRARRGVSGEPTPRSSPRRPASTVKVDFVGWEDMRPQTAVTANTGAGPDIIIGFGRRSAHLCIEAGRADRSRRLSRRQIRRLVRPGAALRQEVGHQELDRAADRRRQRADGLSQVLGEGGRLRQDPERPRRFLTLCQKLQKNGHPCGLRARQRGGRRQRLRRLAAVDARRLRGRRERQGRDRLQGDDRALKYAKEL